MMIAPAEIITSRTLAEFAKGIRNDKTMKITPNICIGRRSPNLSSISENYLQGLSDRYHGYSRDEATPEATKDIPTAITANPAIISSAPTYPQNIYLLF